MQKYVMRRLLTLIPILFGVSVVVFVIMRAIPGDVAMMILVGSGGEGGADQETLNALRTQLGLNEPLPMQYLNWIGGLLKLDAGRSLWSDEPVFSEILQRLPLTIELALLSVFISLWAFFLL